MDCKGHNRTFGVMGMFWILIMVVVSWAYTSVKIHQIMHLNCTLSGCSLCKLYLEVVLKNKIMNIRHLVYCPVYNKWCKIWLLIIHNEFVTGHGNPHFCFYIKIIFSFPNVLVTYGLHVHWMSTLPVSSIFKKKKFFLKMRTAQIWSFFFCTELDWKLSIN